jgi:hypothetical protein
MKYLMWRIPFQEKTFFHVFPGGGNKEIVYARNNFKVVPDEIFSMN